MMALKSEVVQEIEVPRGSSENLLLTGSPTRHPVGAHIGAHLGAHFFGRALQNIVNIDVL